MNMVTTGHTAWLKHGAICCKGDVVLLASATSKWSCGEVKVHLSYASTCFTLISLFSLKEIGKGNAFAIWEDDQSQVAAIPLAWVFTPVLHAWSGQRITTLIPLAWR